MRIYNEYKKEFKIAEANYADLKKRGNEAVGENALEYIDSFLTPEEIAESDLRVALIGEMIKARKEKGITQKQLEKLSGVKQPVIARMECGKTSPQLDTVMKVLSALGMKLVIVPIEDK